MAKKRCASISRAAQCARYRSLNSVEKLKERCNKKQIRGSRDNGEIGRENSCDESRRNPEEQCHATHKTRTQCYPGPACVFRRVWIFSTECLAHSNCRRRSDSERHHVCNADRVQRDLVAG